MTRPMPKQQAQPNMSAQLDAMQHLISVVTGQMEEMRQNITAPAPAPAAEPMTVSARLVIETCRDALYLARGLPAAPSTRTLIQAAYVMACRELEAMK